MAALINEFRAGDTFYLTFDLEKYPASEGWAIEYALRGPTAIDVEGSIENGLYKVEALPAVTQNWVPGNYWAHVVVSLGAEKATIEQGQTLIQPNLTGLTSFDGRSQVKRTLDALTAVLENKAGDAVWEYEIAGRRLRNMELPDIIDAHKYFSKLYQEELKKEAVKQGKPLSHRILHRF